MFICEICRGSNIEIKAWVNPNDYEYLRDCSDGEIEENWCNDCNEPVEFDFLEKE